MTEAEPVSIKALARTPSVLVAGAVLVAALLTASVLLWQSDEPSEAAGTDGGATTTLAPGAGASTAPAGPTTTTGPREPAARGLGLDPELQEDVTTEDFAREGPELGAFAGEGPEWEVLGGEWTVGDEQLTLAAPRDDGANVAAFDPGAADVRAQVRLRVPADAAGLAFRIEDEDSFFVWAWAAAFGNLVLLEVVDGERIVRASTGLADPIDDEPALGINVVGASVELLFEGAVAARFDGLPSADGRERIGVAMLAGAESPVFDDLIVRTPG